VAAKTPFTAGWSLANDGPDRMQLSLPVAVARPENVEVLPLTQPEALLPAQSAQLVPFMVTALAPGSLEFDITFAGTRALHVSSEGQVGMLQLEGEAGERISPDSVLTLPLLKVGGEAVSTVFARNLGTGPLQLGTPNLEGGASCVTARAPVKSLLGPGERTSFEIVLQPVVGSFECELTVPSDDPGFADYTVTFAARGARSAKTGCEGGTGSLVGLALLAAALLHRRAARARRTSPPCR